MKLRYETDRLILKILEPTEADSVLRFYLDNKDLFEKNEPEREEGFYTAEHQRAILTAEYNMAMQGTLFRFWLYRKSAPTEIIGTVSIRDIKRHYRQSCLLGYKLGEQYFHQGYATEALREIIRIIFDELLLHRISAQVMTDNKPSIRLMERLGFVNEGIERKVFYLHGVWTDHIRYSLISSHPAIPEYD